MNRWRGQATVKMMIMLVLLISGDPVIGAVATSVEHKLYPHSTAGQALANTTRIPSGQGQSSLDNSLDASLPPADEVVPHYPEVLPGRTSLADSDSNVQGEVTKTTATSKASSPADLALDAPRELFDSACLLHQSGDVDAAATIYIAMLEAYPMHVDALRLLGLVRFAQAELAESHQDASQARGLFAEALRLVWQSVLVVGGKTDALKMMGDVGEVLRGSGNRRDAERVLRSALRQEDLPPVARPQISFNLAVTLIELNEEQKVRNFQDLGQNAGDLSQRRAGLIDEAEDLLMAVIHDQDTDLRYSAMKQLGLVMRDRGNQTTAIHWFQKVVEHKPNSAGTILELGRSLSAVGRLNDAGEALHEVLSLTAESTDYVSRITRRNAKLNIAAMAFDIGETNQSVAAYLDIISEYHPAPFVALNNLGAALLTMGREQEAMDYLRQAAVADQSKTSPLLNVALQRHRDGDLDEARDLYSRVYDMTGDGGMFVRMALLLSTVPESEEVMVQERKRLLSEVVRLTDLQSRGLLSVATQGQWLETAPFLLVYAGTNQRPALEAIARMHASIDPGIATVAAHLREGDNATRNITTIAGEIEAREIEDGSTDTAGGLRPLRVGFVSKLFGEKEPHGMIVEGMVLYLPRPRFHVTVCAVGGDISRALEAGADRVVRLPLVFEGARLALEQLRLDVLVFTDTACEPVSHFLAMGRVAPVQAAFLGLPVTTGSPAVDYFISADVLEHPNRSAISAEDDAYTEQVVLLEGQGVWYPTPDLPPELAPPPPPPASPLAEARPYVSEKRLEGLEGRGGVAGGQRISNELFPGYGRRAQREGARSILRKTLKDRIGASPNSVVFLCAQSMFKLHPRFDIAVGRVLQASASNYVVFTKGRRLQWTKDFTKRLSRAVGDKLMERVSFVSRTVSGGAFSSLLASADIVLHPFPFGGSKTSADALAVGVPTVAMVGEHPFGRMARSFYRTMGLQDVCCVATDVESYVQLAVRLGEDVAFRSEVVDLIDQRQWVLWERRDEVFEWARVLARIGGIPLPTPPEVGLFPGAEGVLSPPGTVPGR